MAGEDDNNTPRDTGDNENEERPPKQEAAPRPSSTPTPRPSGSVSDGQMRVIVLLVLLLGLEVLRSPQVRNFFKLTFKIPFTQAVSQQSGKGTSLTALQKMTGRTTN
jgi:hypothetical protein